MPRLGPLGDLQFDHPHLVIFGHLRAEQFRIEIAVLRATAEVSRPDLPHQITARFQVVVAQTSFPGVVVEPSLASAGVQRKHGTIAQCPETHGGNVKQGGHVGLLAELTPYLDQEDRPGFPWGRWNGGSLRNSLN